MVHENLNREQRVEGSSDRTFGFVFAAVFVVLSCWPLLSGQAPQWLAAGIAVMFGLLAMVKPGLLTRLNALWMKLGILLGKVVSPVAMGLLFYVVLVPTGALMRLAGKDPLRLKLDPDTDSYWILRDPPAAPLDSMTHPFEMAKITMILEFWTFLRIRKKYWLWPVLLMMALLGLLIVLSQGSAIAPFIYTIF